MELGLASFLHLLIVSSVLCLQARAEAAGSVFFVDSPSHPYLRFQSKSDVVRRETLLLSEVGAAMSVLLGFAPPPTLTAIGSSKLDALLKPNPFDRPRAVFVLEVRGLEDNDIIVDPKNAIRSSSLRHRVDLVSDKAEIQLPDGDEASVVYLDQLSIVNNDAHITDTEISEFASWMGGSYVINALEPLNGELIIPSANGVRLKFDMSKEAERKYVSNLLSLKRKIRRAIEMHEHLSQSMHSPAELMIGCFDGIKALKEQYGTEGVTLQGMELLLGSLSKIFGSLQSAYKGEIVGVILFTGTPASESEKMLDITFTLRSTPRFLEEKKGPYDVKVAEVLLVRRTIAWLTGILLLIATLIGIHYLLNMPVTKDTLLYSNVKLD